MQTDYVSNVLVENVKVLRLPSRVQPNMNHGIYFKAWDGPVSGTPPTGGGGGFGTHLSMEEMKTVLIHLVMG